MISNLQSELERRTKEHSDKCEEARIHLEEVLKEKEDFQAKLLKEQEEFHINILKDRENFKECS